jgi:predicted transcriptional regulator
MNVAHPWWSDERPFSGRAGGPRLTSAPETLNLRAMEIHLSPDKEARLREFASRTGRDASRVVEEALDQMLENERRFIAAVEEGRASARCGELLEHDEVVERVERMIRG